MSLSSPSKRARLSKGEDALIGTADSASLWNVSLSPGWTERDSKLLELALAKFGVGRWQAIVKSGVLPGKSVSQLNLQTQRLLGQQSTREFMGLHLWCSKVGQKNALFVDAPRKNGCIINEGQNITPEETRRRRAQNKELYALSDAEIAAIELPSPAAPSAAATAAVAAAANDDRLAVADAERRARVLQVTQSARACAKPMPMRDWNRAGHLLVPPAADAEAPPPAERHESQQTS
jgi:hypothetical protein